MYMNTKTMIASARNATTPIAIHSHNVDGSRCHGKLDKNSEDPPRRRFCGKSAGMLKLNPLNPAPSCPVNRHTSVMRHQKLQRNGLKSKCFVRSNAGLIASVALWEGALYMHYEDK